MANAKYIENEKTEIEAHKKYVETIPKLPIDPALHKALPKALRKLSIEECSSDNTNVCSKSMMSLIHPLLINSHGKHFNKDESERIAIRKTLEHFVKIKSFRMLEEYHLTIKKIFEMNIFWVRDISSWEPDSKNTYKQFISLVKHLFCKYEVPEFMFQCWTDTNTTNSVHMDWFLHLSEGESAKKLHKFPIPATKKMLHEFINTPFPGYSISDAIRRCQVVGMGGSYQLADSIMMSRLRHNFNYNDFWSSVIQYFINTPMLNVDEVGPIIDYINEKKFVSKHIIREGKRIYSPEEPNFSIKGRNIETLIRDTQNWHKELQKSSKTDMSTTWIGTQIKDFTHKEGRPDKENYKVYEIIEIKSAKELHREGKTMHHCVFSYLSSCVKGSCSIFSLKIFGISLATIEVRDNRAVQIRGIYNRKIDQKEIFIINNWAKENNIEITKYAIAGA